MRTEVETVVDLRVDPATLKSFGRQLAEEANVARAGGSYVGRHGSLSLHQQGLAGLIQPAHERFVNEIVSTLTYLGALLERCEDALKAAASWYEETDRRSATRLDATYPMVNRPSPEPEG
jgi:hypothetical protein